MAKLPLRERLLNARRHRKKMNRIHWQQKKIAAAREARMLAHIERNIWKNKIS